MAVSGEFNRKTKAEDESQPKLGDCSAENSSTNKEPNDNEDTRW
jgi:hypothetical protein